MTFRTDRVGIARFLGLVTMSLPGLVGCGGLFSHAAAPPKVGEAAEGTGLGTCEAAKDPLHPLIVEWPATRKADVEAAAQQGPVVVSYVGCVMKVLTDCRATGGGTYELQATTPVAQSVAIEDENQLRSNLPFSAATFEGELTSGRRLILDYVAVGKKILSSPPTMLTGACPGATHYVSSMVIGAFSLTSEASLKGALKASAGSSTVDAMGAGKRQLGGSSGDVDACKEQGADVEGCHGLLELGLLPIQAAGAGRVASGGFGAGLSNLPVIPQMGALQEVDLGGGLAEVDDERIAILRALQAARRAERDAAATSDAKANAWDSVAQHHGTNPYAAAAAQRRDDWARLANAERQRQAAVRDAWDKFNADKSKLETLEALDDDVVSRSTKTAYRNEFESVYGPWKASFHELGLDAPPAPPPEPANTAAWAPIPDRPPEVHTVRPLQTWGITLGAVGATLIGGSIWATVAANHGKSDVESGSLATGGDIENEASKVRTLQGFSYVGYPVGGALLLTGLGMLIWGPSYQTTLARMQRPGTISW